MSSMMGQMPMSGFGKTGNKIPSGYKAGQMQQFTPEQMQLFQQQFSQVGPQSYLSRLAGGDQSFFNEIEAPAHRQFGEYQGNLASRFSGWGGAGSTGARRSSGFQNTMNQAGSDFAQDLQSRRQEMRQNAIRELMGFSNQILNQRPYDQFLVEKQQKQSPWGTLIGAGLGGTAGFFAGGPMGAMQGAQIGGQIGSKF